MPKGLESLGTLLEGTEDRESSDTEETKPDFQELVDEGKGIMVDGKFVSFDGDTDKLIDLEQKHENENRSSTDVSETEFLDEELLSDQEMDRRHNKPHHVRDSDIDELDE